MTANIDEFTGFGVDAMRFLAGLEANNTKPYFDEHRSLYQRQVRGPLQELCVAVGERLADTVAPNISFAPKVGRSMFRINRDLRFAADKTPKS